LSGRPALAGRRSKGALLGPMPANECCSGKILHVTPLLELYPRKRCFGPANPASRRLHPAPTDERSGNAGGASHAWWGADPAEGHRDKRPPRGRRPWRGNIAEGASGCYADAALSGSSTPENAHV
jgi:hypothetical protein